MSRQSLQDESRPVKRGVAIPLAAGLRRRLGPARRRFIGSWRVPGLGVVKAFGAGDLVTFRHTPPLDALGRATWACYRDELEAQARARLRAWGADR